MTIAGIQDQRSCSRLRYFYGFDDRFSDSICWTNAVRASDTRFASSYWSFSVLRGALLLSLLRRTISPFMLHSDVFCVAVIWIFDGPCFMTNKKRLVFLLRRPECDDLEFLAGVQVADVVEFAAGDDDETTIFDQ